jgi:phosphatidate cytidylyltransferase
LGGLLVASLGAHFQVLVFMNHSPLLFSVLGVFLAIMGVVGDLFESFIKRAVGVKDSGNLIPGHGGILDRVDALLWTGPTFYLILKVCL